MCSGSFTKGTDLAFVVQPGQRRLRPISRRSDRFFLIHIIRLQGSAHLSLSNFNFASSSSSFRKYVQKLFHLINYLHLSVPLTPQFSSTLPLFEFPSFMARRCVQFIISLSPPSFKGQFCLFHFLLTATTVPVGNFKKEDAHKKTGSLMIIGRKKKRRKYVEHDLMIKTGTYHHFLRWETQHFF